MSNKHPERERWEILVTTILLAYRPLLFIGGLVILGYALTVLFTHPIIASLSLGMTLFMFLLVTSDRAIFCFARLGAWIATIGKHM